MSRTVGAALAAASVRLAEAGIPDAPRDARALVAHATGVPADRIALERDRTLDPDAEQRLGQALAARIDRRPVSQITGTRLFWGRPFRVTSDTLDPRPETESLVALALAGPRPGRVLDLGTGTGILAVTLLAEWPSATGIATDLADSALDVAAANARAHGVADRLELRAADWFAGISGRFDLIVSNPPYIPEADLPTLAPEVGRWEPRAALTPGGDGLDAYRRIAVGLRAHLAPGGRALLEFGIGQGDAVAAIFGDRGLASSRLHPDMTGRPRLIEIGMPRN